MSIRIRTSVPATSANLGPGYDVLGLALNIHFKAMTELAGEWSVKTSGEGTDILATGRSNLVARACQRICTQYGWEARPMRIKCNNPIPIARGLGSSATAIVTGMALAQLVNIGRLDKDVLFQEAAAMEGHPDNVAAAVYGGLQEVSQNGSGYRTRSRPMVDSIRILLVVPGAMKSTAKLREIIPQELPAEVQVDNDKALRFVLAGLAKGDQDQLRFSEADQRHQPQRLAVQPESQAIFKLLQGIPQVAGAFLSGAGTTVAGWVIDESDCTGSVEEALREQSIVASVHLVKPDLKGVKGEVVE